MLEEKRTEENDYCPLSPAVWIMFLSEEINRKDRFRSAFITAILTVMATLVAVIVALVVVVRTSFISTFIDVVGLMIIFLLIILIVFELVYSLRCKKGIEILEELRRTIIFGEEKDSTTISKKWWAIVSNKRGNGLEKSEIDGKTGKLIIGSANFWYALGGSCVAIGGVAISIGHAIDSPKLSIFNFVSGLAIFMAGISMIKGAYNIETKSEKRPVCLPLKELWHTNNWLFLAFLFLIAWAILNIIPYFL